MKKQTYSIAALVLTALLVVLTACGPGATETPEPTDTSEPTAPPATEAPSDEEAPDEATTEAEPTGPFEALPAEQAGTCEPQALPTIPASDPNDADWSKGASADEAEVTILEYSDFECPGCSAIAPVLSQFLEENPEVRLIYRHFPLSFHEKAMLTSEAAEAAGAQGKFWEMHDLLFAEADEWKALSKEEAREKMSEYAEQLELDVEQFDSELDDDTHVPHIEEELAESQELGLPGTPTFIFNNIVYPTEQLGLSYQGLTSFMAFLDAAENQYEAPPELTLDPEGEYEAVVSTTQGDITFDLLVEAAPTLINNFQFLAVEGWYDNSDFFFVQDNFVALTGDPTDTGIGYPGYYCTGETQNAFDRAGLVGMLPNGQFFFTLGTDASNLSQQFALIGQVTDGEDVLDALARVQPGDPTAEADSVEAVIVKEK
jgi:protein-disulfide isomerase/cyclophilin family peptidyl-prolyl cis-trans isomerase